MHCWGLQPQTQEKSDANILKAGIYWHSDAIQHSRTRSGTVTDALDSDAGTRSSDAEYGDNAARYWSGKT